MNLCPIVSLTEAVGEIPAGDIFYIPEFKDGLTYLRAVGSKSFQRVEHDTLTRAIAESEHLKESFDADLL